MSVPHGPSLLLATPDAALGASYRGLLAEVIAAEEALIPFPLAFPSDDIDALLVRLDGCARGIDLPEGFVPHSTTGWCAGAPRSSASPTCGTH